MTFWIVAGIVVIVVGSLVWWSSGRAKPDLRRRSDETEIAIRRASPGVYGVGQNGSIPGNGSGPIS
jgi:hypothetical protein